MEAGTRRTWLAPEDRMRRLSVHGKSPEPPYSTASRTSEALSASATKYTPRNKKVSRQPQQWCCLTPMMRPCRRCDRAHHRYGLPRCCRESKLSHQTHPLMEQRNSPTQLLEQVAHCTAPPRWIAAARARSTLLAAVSLSSLLLPSHTPCILRAAPLGSVPELPRCSCSSPGGWLCIKGI